MERKRQPAGSEGLTAIILSHRISSTNWSWRACEREGSGLGKQISSSLISPSFPAIRHACRASHRQTINHKALPLSSQDAKERGRENPCLALTKVKYANKSVITEAQAEWLHCVWQRQKSKPGEDVMGLVSLGEANEGDQSIVIKLLTWAVGWGGAHHYVG